MSTRFWAAMALILTMVLPSVLLARGPVVAQAATNGAGPTPVETNKAKAEALYKNGQVAFDDGEYEKAAEIFKAAYKLDPNPLLLYNVARAYESGDKTAEAIATWTEYSELKDQRATSKGHARKRVLELQAQLTATKAPASSPAPASAPASVAPASAPTSNCTLVLRDVPTDATAKLNGKVVDATAPIQTDCLEQAVQIMRGSVQIGGGRVAMTPNKETVWVYEPNTPPIIDANKLTPKAEETPLLTRKQWGWVAVGTSAAALIGGSALGMLAKSEGPEAHTASAQDSVRGKMLGANILFGTSLVAGGVGAYLLLWGDDDTPHAELAPSPTGAVLTGTF